MMRILLLLLLLLPPLAARCDEASSIDGLNGRIMQLYNQGDYAGATPLARQLVGLLEQSYGPQSLQFASGLNNLAELYVKQNQPRQAEPLYRRALAIRESLLPPDHPDLQKSRTRLTELLRNNPPPAPPPPPPAPPPRQMAAPPPPRVNQANEQMQKAMALNQQALQLGNQGRAAEAIPLAKQVLAIFEANLPPDHANIAIGLGNLAQLEAQAEQYDQALPLYQRSLALLQKSKSTNPVNIGYTNANIADLYAQLHKFADAELYYKQAIPLLDKAPGVSADALARILNNLAECYRAQGKLPETDPLMKGRIKPAPMALPGGKLPPEPAKIPNPDDIEQAAALDHRLFELLDKNDYPAALKLATELQSLLDRMYGPDSMAVAVNLDQLVTLYRQLGRGAEAAEFEERAKRIRQRAGQRDRSLVQPP